MVLRDDYLAALREHIAETMAQNVAFLKRVRGVLAGLACVVLLSERWVGGLR